MAVQSDGKIVVAGTADAPGRNDFALARYNDDGSLDTSFDGDGEVTTSFGVQVQANAFSMALQADGKIVVAGYVSDHNSIDFALARYNSDGSLDTSFDGDGKLTVKGFFATEPTRVNFEMDFVLAGDEWKLLRLNVVLASVP